jgi:CubicO group peptidase (beta-lactamase class C family)
MRLPSHSDERRIADLVELRPPGALVSAIQDPIAERAYKSVAAGTSTWSTRAARSSDVPAANGYGNARSIARLGAIAAQAGVLDGRRYLSRTILAEASSLQVDAVDPILGPMRLGLGFGLDSEGLRAPTPSCFHWGGYGGSFLVMDPSTGVSCAYAMNNLLVGDNLLEYPRITHLWSTLGDVMGRL